MRAGCSTAIIAALIATAMQSDGMKRHKPIFRWIWYSMVASSIALQIAKAAMKQK